MRRMSRPAALTVTLGVGLAGLVQVAAQQASFEPVRAPGIENLYRLSPSVYSGAQPEGPEAFAALKRLGVTTIVSVDGARPDVESARRAGLRYVHLPVGYDGVDREQALRIVKAVQTAPGPVFVHCHHGKHRGPTAAALACLATAGWDHERAKAWLKQAGTSPSYQGLFETVRDFEKPSSRDMEKVPLDLPERAEVPAVVKTMVQIDEQWDRLTACKEAGYRSPAGHLDVDPAHEALLLSEQFHELLRAEAKARGEDFERRLRDAEKASRALEAALRRFEKDRSSVARDELDVAYQAAAKSCTSCHEAYRNRKKAVRPGS